MTVEIALVLAIVAAALVLFVTEWVRNDIVALLVLLAVALTGLVGPREALSGFSNPAVITVWAVFILSGGLQRTGVATMLGNQILRLMGSGEVRLIVGLMITAAFFSAFMNNVGVAALLLPVVMDLARRTGQAPSKLLIPLSYACLLGGLTTLIGTPPNILVADALREHGLEPFGLFDFAPVGLVVVLAGVVFMVVVGRRLLPLRGDLRRGAGGDEDLSRLYELGELLRIVVVPPDSRLAGKSLAESRLGAVLGLNVLGVQRGGRTRLAPDGDTVIEGGDRLLVEGSAERLVQLQEKEYLEIEEERLAVERLASAEVDVAEVVLPPTFRGRTLRQIDFRRRFGLIVLSILRDGETLRYNLETVELELGDRLLVQGASHRLEEIARDPDFEVQPAGGAEVYELEQQLMVVGIPEGSPLAGRVLSDSRLGDAFGLGVLGIVRDGKTHLMPEPSERLQAGDTLFVKGLTENLATVDGLRRLKIETAEIPLAAIESEEIGLAEVVLSPRSDLPGKTLREIHFREKYGLSVVAIAREGDVLRTGLRRLPLRFGDALLVHGPREKVRLLGTEPDFLVLTQEAQAPVRREKAPVAAIVMAAVLLPVLLGWLPIYIAAVAGATLMVILGCLSMDEAYRSIEWRAVFLIAGMLPLGIALDHTGAAGFLTEKVLALVGGAGPLAIVATLYVLTALSAQFMPTAAVAILMAPIALNTAAESGLSPFALLMTVALSSSASFLSPVAHPANLLIMGPGGYKFTDYTKVGLPLTLLCLVVVLLVLPLVWPLSP